MTTPELKNKTYHAWRNMIRRCYDPRMDHYEDYGGRGIKVCVRWSTPQTGFANFVEDQGYAPTMDHSNGRINNDGDYEPGNVEWQLWDAQYRNKRPHSKTVWVHIGKHRVSMNEFCDRCKMGHNLWYQQSSMTLDEFIAKYAHRFDNPNPPPFDPMDKSNTRWIEINGERMSLNEFCKRCNKSIQGFKRMEDRKGFDYAFEFHKRTFK